MRGLTYRSVPSQALSALTDRLRDVDQLMNAHEAVGDRHGVAGTRSKGSTGQPF